VTHIQWEVAPSGRADERRYRVDEASRWVGTEISVFRVEHGAALDGLMTDVLGVLLHKGLLSLDLVAQDGTRVRASAAAPSFRREA
jgi:hypothetical protein